MATLYHIRFIKFFGRGNFMKFYFYLGSHSYNEINKNNIFKLLIHCTQEISCNVSFLYCRKQGGNTQSINVFN